MFSRSSADPPTPKRTHYNRLNFAIEKLVDVYNKSGNPLSLKS